MNNGFGIENDLFLRSLALEKTECVPVWIMRQAGRYLPEYRFTRAKAGSFLKLCRNPDLAVEVTMQPIERFGMDAAIVFSDILVIPDGYNLGLDFAEGKGPWLEHPLRDEKDITALGDFDVASIGYQGEVVAACRKALAGRVPLIGFAGGPFTLTCYMIDGKGGEFIRARAMLNSRPELVSILLEKNAAAIASSLAMQAEQGADALMIFDSWAGLVRPDQVQLCLANPLRSIMKRLQELGCNKPVLVFWRNATAYANLAIDCGVKGLGVDWLADLGALSQKFSSKVALQGNMDPAVLLTDPENIRAQVKAVLNAHSGSRGHIFNLGHGISKDTNPEYVHILVEAVREFGVY